MISDNLLEYQFRIDEKIAALFFKVPRSHAAILRIDVDA